MKIGYILLFLILSCFLYSCKSTKKIVVYHEIPNLTENRLLKNIYTNELEFNSLYSKRMDVVFTQNGKSTNLRGTLKVQRDSFIQISVSAPLGIEIGRVLLTRDSIKFINSFHKKYFLSDYKYFYDKFEANLSYDCFQKILTNTFFNFEDCSGSKLNDKKYKLDKEGNSYVLSTLEEKTLGRKIRKLYRKKRKNKEFALILQKIQIDSKSFRPVSMSVEDVEEEVGVSVNYNNFQNFEGKFFPEKIILNLFSENDKISLEIQFTRLEFDTVIEPNFRISSKYKPME